MLDIAFAALTVTAVNSKGNKIVPSAKKEKVTYFGANVSCINTTRKRKRALRQLPAVPMR